jgi:Mg2+ and Co2+ transporter CorA
MGRKTKIQMGNKMKEEIEKTSTFKQNQEMCKWYFEQGKSEAQAETQKKVEELKKELQKSFDKCDWIDCDAGQHNEFEIIDKIFNPKNEVTE